MADSIQLRLVVEKMLFTGVWYTAEKHFDISLSGLSLRRKSAFHHAIFMAAIAPTSPQIFAHGRNFGRRRAKRRIRREVGPDYNPKDWENQ